MSVWSLKALNRAGAQVTQEHIAVHDTRLHRLFVRGNNCGKTQRGLYVEYKEEVVQVASQGVTVQISAGSLEHTPAAYVHSTHSSLKVERQSSHLWFHRLMVMNIHNHLTRCSASRALHLSTLPAHASTGLSSGTALQLCPQL